MWTRKRVSSEAIPQTDERAVPCCSTYAIFKCDIQVGQAPRAEGRRTGRLRESQTKH